MSDTVRIARMRLHRARDRSPDGHAAVRALDLAPSAPDRSVLVIRRLSVLAADARTARERVTALRRGAARPALGPVPPDCPAVVFNDEAEALSCLTADLVADRAADRWYWPADIRTGAAAAGIGTTLARLWLARPGFLPATLALTARRSPSDAVRAVGLLSDAEARAVAAAMLAAFRATAVPPGSGPTAVPDRLLPPVPGRPGSGATLRPAGQALLALGLTLAATPSAARDVRLLREIDGLLRSADASSPEPAGRDTSPESAAARSAADGAGQTPDAPAGLGSTAADGTAAAPAADPARRPAHPPAGERPPVRPGTRSPRGAGRAPDDAADGTPAPERAGIRSPLSADEAARRPTTTSEQAPVGPVRRSATVPGGARPPAGQAARGTVDAAPRPEGPWRHGRWPGGDPGRGEAVESRFATLFYAVNLMTWLDLPSLDAPESEPDSGWGTLEALGRSLLGVPPAGPGTASQDPVWRVLAELDGRDPSTPTPVRPEVFTDRLHDLLDRRGLAPEAFAQPGTLVIGRTHVDVLLGLEQIDLTARSSGLDQDPGWVPALGRIIAFHFDGGS
ncbi:hypothetical protein [Streptomyces sp. NPDC048277]|uniref:hypothetical protein n=1 Tax=Streptomyces sp. NPDC048277 TaxID=3155027 RepID=UPI0033F676BC